MDRKTHQLIQSCYETVVAPGTWPKFLQQLTEAMDAKGCLIFEIDHSDREIRVPLFNEAFQGELLNAYMSLFAGFEQKEQSRFDTIAASDDRIELVRDQQLFDHEDARKSQANVQALGNFGIGYRAFALLDKDNRSRYRFSIQQSGRHGALSEGEERMLQNILPHMAKALQLGRPFVEREASHEGLLTAMSQLGVGIAILDAQGREAFANTEHHRQCEAFDTFRKTPGGHLQMNANGDSVRLNRLLGDMLAHGGFGARPRREAIPFEGGGQLGAICLEISPRPEGGAILYSYDTTRPISVDAGILRQVYGLTDAETEVLTLAAEGLTNPEIAERRGRSAATINVQLKSLLAKTDCANRTQLARLMLNFGAKTCPV
ncbi:MAG: helix-turn-helix transcriptional regulator [Pseudomonadota bacterium]